LNFKRKKGLLIKISILCVALLVSVILLTGCVSGQVPVGWSGIDIGENGTAYAGSKQGQLIALNLTNNSVTARGESLKPAPTSGFSCASTGSAGSACGGAAPSVAIYGTPALATDPGFGNLVFIAGYNGKIFAYDANTLQQKWTYPVDSYLKPIVSAIVVSGNTLYFGCTDSKLYALNTAGGLKWTFSTGGEIWSSPTIDNNLVLISSFDRYIYAVDASTGKEKWRFLTGANNVATPLVLDGVVYTGSLDRNLYALDENTGSKVWSFTGKNWFWTRPVAVNGVIYAPCLDSQIYALDAKTGDLKAGPFNAGGQVASWPVVVNNQIIAATKNGKLVSLDSSNLGAGLKQITTIPNEVTAPLSAFDGKIYINGTDNNIYVYDLANNGNKVATISLTSQ
jgi:eukaryotic-like serine/threonine-protein kinase